MSAPGTRSPWRMERTGPFIIGHRGNSLPRMKEFIDDGVDFVEIDLWLHRDELELRHERALYPLPLLFERWYLKRRPPRFDLAETLLRLDGDAFIFLDIKNGGPEIVAPVQVARLQVPDAPISASAADWPALRALHDHVDGVDVFYSISVPEQLDLFFSVYERDPRPVGVSCRATLLTRDTVQRLHDLGLRVVAWTVDHLDQAGRLADWGVDAITTHRPSAVRAAVA